MAVRKGWPYAGARDARITCFHRFRLSSIILRREQIGVFGPGSLHNINGQRERRRQCKAGSRRAIHDQFAIDLMGHHFHQFSAKTDVTGVCHCQPNAIIFDNKNYVIGCEFDAHGNLAAPVRREGMAQRMVNHYAGAMQCLTNFKRHALDGCSYQCVFSKRKACEQAIAWLGVIPEHVGSS
ncbi:MAG: hypothetical protein KJ871_09580 [Alphaproteobacteria bacterium]|nr:hypothetical protein [Alphaproteobacteria bacterium]MBU2084129.1 hypothetical protein [Alphaproteobacteria bacterium]MBU2144336.1 hypothetical protein [Alphaproteobacteria bacterium]MBU2196406.1 hypothetical protein [Alphaproteobacteria bacterium]